jgi:hypothetical protein
MTLLCGVTEAKEGTSGFLREVDMATTTEKLVVLRNELQFLDRGGYRSPIQWRSPRIFEDSPTCPKDRWAACPHGDCVLLEFVPEQSRDEAIPCRHIPLNESGETLETLYSTATNEEIQKTLREWLLKTIAGLEQIAQVEMPERGEKAG